MFSTVEPQLATKILKVDRRYASRILNFASFYCGKVANYERYLSTSRVCNGFVQQVWRERISVD